MLQSVKIQITLRIPGCLNEMNIHLVYDRIQINKAANSDFDCHLTSTEHESSVHLRIPSVAWTYPYSDEISDFPVLVEGVDNLRTEVDNVPDVEI